ncbi:hypothetical protein [uncultured Roseobacter sp.]|uniref:hypothetical protein n=1 Tax=uncultured Roseobacter sp. TaxID=114847 RepID=UPI002617611E|nr:hypothetical protein [uncultured Roseobacter sp.]
MEDESALDAAKHSMRWWNRYYHFLLYVHFSLGIMGILVGALIAADFESDMLVLNPQFLGVLSTLIVGVVSFVQPGRMASVFYDAYWRMRVAILRHSEGQSDAAALVDAIANGFTAVAEIQPESLGTLEASGRDASEGELTDHQKMRLAEFREELLKENAESEEAEKVDPV